MPVPLFCLKMLARRAPAARRVRSTGPIFFMLVFGVLLHDDVDRRRELDVAADVIAMRVRVDDRRHRLVRELLDLVEDRLAPARILRVDDDDAVAPDEDGGVAAAALAA